MTGEVPYLNMRITYCNFRFCR